MDSEQQGLVINAASNVPQTGMNCVETEDLSSSVSVKFKGLFKSKRKAYVELNDSVRETRGIKEPKPSILTNNSPIPRPVCRAVIIQLDEILKRYLDFVEILPFLTSKQLLDTESQYYLKQRAIPINEKVEFLVKKLLENSMDDVLTPFVECFQEYENQNGGVKDAFKDIVDEIDTIWRKETKNIKENTTSRKLQHFCTRYFCLILPIILIVSLMIMLLITLAIFIDVSHFQKQGSQAVTNVKRTNILISLNHLINKQWISTITMRWKDSTSLCTGNVTVITKIHCLDSQLLLHVHHFGDTNPFFALPGSSIVVTIPDRNESKNLVVRLKKSITEYKNFLNLPQRNKEPCSPERNCYQTNEYLNSTLSFNISESDFYYIFLINNSDGSIVRPQRVKIDFDFDILSFNQTAVAEYVSKHSINPVYINNDNKTFSTIIVSEWFDFIKSTCILLSFFCNSGNFPAFVLENAKPRGDIIFIVFLLFSFSLIVPCICLLVNICRVKTK